MVDLLQDDAHRSFVIRWCLHGLMLGEVDLQLVRLASVEHSGCSAHLHREEFFRTRKNNPYGQLAFGRRPLWIRRLAFVRGPLQIVPQDRVWAATRAAGERSPL